jgi:hypothetical protein
MTKRMTQPATAGRAQESGGRLTRPQDCEVAPRAWSASRIASACWGQFQPLNFSGEPVPLGRIAQN